MINYWLLLRAVLTSLFICAGLTAAQPHAPGALNQTVSRTYQRSFNGSADSPAGQLRFDFACSMKGEDGACYGTIGVAPARGLPVRGMIVQGQSSLIISVATDNDDLQCTLTEFQPRRKPFGYPARQHTLHIACNTPLGESVSTDTDSSFQFGASSFRLP